MGLGIWEWFPPGIWHDDGVYVLLGRALATGEGLRYSGVAGDYLAPKFPPVFPLLLAFVWRLAPSFPENILLLCGINLILMAVAGGLFVAYVKRTFGLPLPVVLGTAALAWISPGLWRLAMVPLSEPLFLLLLIVSFWSAARLEREGGGRSLALFLLAATTLALTRSMGVVVLMGLCGGLFLLGRKREGMTALLGGVLLALPWMLFSHGAAGAIPSPLRDTLGPYGSWLVGEMTRDPGAYLAYLPGNAVHLLARVLSLLLPGVVGHWVWGGVLLLPALAVGLLELGRKSPAVPLTLGAALGILLLWPFQDVRLLLPFQPFLFLAVAAGFHTLLGAGKASRGRRRSVLVVGGGWILLVAATSVFRLGTGWPGESYRVRTEALYRAVKAVNEKTPPGAVIGAPELWSGIALFTGREVSPSARFRPLTGSVPVWGSPEEQYELWVEAGVTHLLVEHGGGVHGTALDRIDALCPPGTVVVLDMQPGQFLVELAWDEACREVLLAGGS